MGWINYDSKPRRQNIVYFFKSLSNLCEEHITNTSIENKYQEIEKRKLSKVDQIEVYRCLHFSIQHLSCLSLIKNSKEGIRRLSIASIPSWYYGVYFAARAFCTAYSGPTKDSHIATADVFAQEHICALLMFPFGLRLNILDREDITKIVESSCVLKDLQINNQEVADWKTIKNPAISKEYCLQILNYLKGTARRSYEEIKKKYKKDNGIKSLSKEKEQKMKNEMRQKPKYIGFLHEAYRFRKKIHYKDERALTHVPENSSKEKKFSQSQLKELNTYLYKTLEKFLKMSLHYCEKRTSLEEFKQDILDNTPFEELYNELKIN